jgi:hypothetical protein
MTKRIQRATAEAFIAAQNLWFLTGQEDERCTPTRRANNDNVSIDANAVAKTIF